jgi:hypothetical protein
MYNATGVTSLKTYGITGTASFLPNLSYFVTGTSGAIYYIQYTTAVLGALPANSFVIYARNDNGSAALPWQAFTTARNNTAKYQGITLVSGVNSATTITAVTTTPANFKPAFNTVPTATFNFATFSTRMKAEPATPFYTIAQGGGAPQKTRSIKNNKAFHKTRKQK